MRQHLLTFSYLARGFGLALMIAGISSYRAYPDALSRFFGGMITGLGLSIALASLIVYIINNRS